MTMSRLRRDRLWQIPHPALPLLGKGEGTHSAVSDFWRRISLLNPLRLTAICANAPEACLLVHKTEQVDSYLPGT